MRILKVLGIFMMVASPISIAFYTAWFVGLIGWLDKELAVKIAVYIIVIMILAVIGLLGYVMATAPKPAVIGPGGGGSRG